MVVFYFLIIVLVLCGVKVANKGMFFEDYMGKIQCNAIKGIFILVVFMRHAVPYVVKAGYEMPTFLDKSFSLIDAQIGQLLVVMFLFYSGFGVMASINKKGGNYINDIPKKRILTTFINFDVAVGLFLLMDFALGIEVDAEQYFLARFGWDSVGNSNWYIFVILLLYTLTYFSFKLNRGAKGERNIVIMSVLTVAILFMVKSFWWYNTLLSYPAGMFFFIYKERIENVIRNKYTTILLGLFFLLSIIHIVNIKMSSIIYAYSYNFESIIFALLIVTLTMKVKIGNKILLWLGINLFPLYIYQRIPMILMRESMGNEWLADNPYLFCIISLLGMILITYLYKYWKISL